MEQRKIGDTYIFKPERGVPERVYDSLLRLVPFCPRHREGFTPEPGSNQVDLLFAPSGESIGPISFSTDVRRLLCYSVRYHNDTLGCLFFSGNSILQACKDGELPARLLEIHQKCSEFGRITDHRLTFVKTPQIFAHPIELAKYERAQISLRDLLQRPFPDREAWLPHVNFTSVELRNWSASSVRLPACTFHTNFDGSQLFLRTHIQNDGADESKRDSETVHITNPRTTFVRLR